ncbi:hypothetical protein Tco_1005619 [Tanacetum coccineum]|uniref:Uncharacterized protein n=1 Tax=Tanacetum coccineum TaxID=301880 RepID=A0ABQ5FFV1_9ASTR
MGILPSVQPSDHIENVADEAVHKELGNSLVRAATTASSLEAEQDNGYLLLDPTSIDRIPLACLRFSCIR